jgi:hypothetical protein
MRSRIEICCDILSWGLLNIRNHANDAERCFAESDPLHNIPELLRNFEKVELHRYYWEVTRPCFISTSRPDWLHGFWELWAELEDANRRET